MMLAFDQLEAEAQAALRVALLAALKWAWHRRKKTRYVKAQPTSMSYKVLELADQLPGLSAGAPAAAFETLDALLSMRTAGTLRQFHVLLSRLDHFVQPQLARATTDMLAHGLDAERRERMAETAAMRDDLREIGDTVRNIAARVPQVGAPLLASCNSGGPSPLRVPVVGTPVHAPLHVTRVTSAASGQLSSPTPPTVPVAKGTATPTGLKANSITAFGDMCFRPFSPALRLCEKAERLYRAVEPERVKRAYELCNESHLLFSLSCVIPVLTLILSVLPLIFSMRRMVTAMVFAMALLLIYVLIFSVLSFRAVSDRLVVALHQ